MHAQSAVKTFLFTDIEGSTHLWEQVPERMRRALAQHDAITRLAVEAHRGVIVKMAGDGAHAVFDDPLDAVDATVQLQRALADPNATDGIGLRVRCGMHVGVDEQRDNDFFGRSSNRAARIMAAAHGGQVLLSQAVAALTRDRLPTGISLRDLGSVRLRDLVEPERVYQIVHPTLQQDFPALRSLEATPNNLPHQVTSFVGRERELAQIKSLLTRTRLLTLLGPGGIGKTRLSLQVAAEIMDDYPDGVWFVELASLTDPRLVPQALASVLGVKEDAGHPVIQAVLKFVKDRRLLIILDNCEHLMRACASLVTHVLQSGPLSSILASSREPLRVTGETSYPVPPLSTPEVDATVTPASLAQYAAARLFIQRVTAIQPHFQVTQQEALAVADICHRLDGIPLAIELAAGRARSLSLATIAERLDDRLRLLGRGNTTVLPRQQTLRASIDWSYELLSEQEQALWRRLAVFAGSWTLDAAEAVGAGVDADSQLVLDLLTNLVEKSLVSLAADGDRYRLLDTVRQYAQERLTESGDGDATRARHLAFYVRLAEDGQATGIGPGQGAWFSRLDLEWENLLAAFAYCALVAEGAKAGLRLGYAVMRWIVSRGPLRLGYRLLVQAITRTGAQERDLSRCRALCAAGELAFLTGVYGKAKEHIEESLAIARDLGDRARVAEALRLLGYVALAHGEHVEALQQFESALALSRDVGEKSLLAAALNGLAELHRTQGELHKARMLYEEALALDREVGDRRRLAVHLCNLAGVLIESETGESRFEVLLEALTIAEEIGSKQVGRAVLEYSAGLGALHREWELAARLHGAAEMQAEQMGYHREPMDEAFLPPLMARVREALGEAAFTSSEAAGRKLAYEQAMAEARAWLESAQRTVSVPR